MTTQYSRSVLKVVVAQICQTIGWHSINSTPLEFMVDLMQDYMLKLAKLSQEYAQVLGRSEANLDDLGLAFQHMDIDLQELTEYVKNVEPVPCVIPVPKLPIQRENHLNFLKPGSREVVTRPVYVHEHLPAMYPDAEEEYQAETKETEPVSSNAPSQVANIAEEEINENNNIITTNGASNDENSVKTVSQPVFKRPGDPVSFDGPVVKRIKTTEEGRPLREIHSVIMTTSGFLSTAREGKLPEARTPQQERAESPPPPPSYPMVPPEVKVETTTKKLKKIPKKTATEDGKPENKENKKKKIPKDILFQPDEIKDVKVKKMAGTKDIAKLKALKQTAKVGNPNLAGPSNLPVTGKGQGKMPGGSPKHAKNAIVTNKIKSEKPEIMPNVGNQLLNDRKEEPVDKLPIEPDKQKLNIFKKISSKPKEDKDRDSLDPVHKLKEFSVHENSSHIVANDAIVKQEDKKPIVHNPLPNNNAVRSSVPDDSVTNMMSPGSDGYMFDMSPPRTPSTPKTPELSVPNMIAVEQKKKRKDKNKKKESKLKTPKNSMSTKKARLSNDSASDVNILDRPKTPQAPEQQQPPLARDPNITPTMPFPFFPTFSASPGLIPQPMFPLPLNATKGLPNMMAAPNPAAAMMLGQRFFRPPKPDSGRPFVPPTFMNDPHQNQPSTATTFPLKPQQTPHLSEAKPRTSRSPEKELALHSPTKPVAQQTFHVPNVLPPVNATPAIVNNSLPTAAVPVPIIPPVAIPPALVPAPLVPPSTLPIVKPLKPEKSEKSEKKSKEHKKKDKLKKKKEKKEKYKEKGEKTKEKKDKSEKKEKLEKLKEKKEKKEKRKEKGLNKKITKEEKPIESVPKLTLKLGPAGGSPRPPTPENALMKKITIKPPKKPEDEVKREPTPELARISALVTRPPKQKSTSKKAEGTLEAYSTLPSEASFSSTTLALNSRAKKPSFKPISHGEFTTPSFSYTESFGSLKPLDEKQYTFVDASGKQIWICPACGKQDDGSPMIGCDDCDGWYHWVCVGIQVAPADSENWYCRLCISKNQEQFLDKKKKKRKKKMKITA